METYDPYRKYGLNRVINAATSLTRLGGSIPHDEVFDSMRDASRAFVRIPELQKWAGAHMSKKLGTEDALPTSGAACALMLACAACIFRGTELDDYDPLEKGEFTHIIQKLPLKTKGLRNEFVVMKNDRNVYDHSVECAGGVMVEAGKSHSVAIEDLHRSVDSKKTAAFYYTIQPKPELMPIEEYAEVAHEYDLPLIVDAAPNLTHKEVPRILKDRGVDLMIFSGGKQLGGPNNSGILAGREDLIKLAHLNSYPFDGVGRAAKMSRETIVGLVKALDIFTDRDDTQYYKGMEKKSRELADELDKIKGLKSGVLHEPTIDPSLYPPTYTYIEAEKGSGINLNKVHEFLMESVPPIETLYEPFFISPEAAGKLTFKVEYLLPGDKELIIKRIEDMICKSLERT
jgi:L-seryl-tRNA(Ser) seleniumtransferase